MSKKKTPIDIVSRIRQMETLTADVAIIFASYYKALINNDVPENLAKELTLAYHDIWWSEVMDGGGNALR